MTTLAISETDTCNGCKVQQIVLECKGGTKAGVTGEASSGVRRGLKQECDWVEWCSGAGWQPRKRSVIASLRSSGNRKAWSGRAGARSEPHKRSLAGATEKPYRIIPVIPGERAVATTLGGARNPTGMEGPTRIGQPPAPRAVVERLGGGGEVESTTDGLVQGGG